MHSQLILFGHGSRDPTWRAAFDELADVVRKTVGGKCSVDAAFLQFISPTLAETVQSGVNRGMTDVHILPVFLFPGQHISIDLPEAVEDLRTTYPSLRIVVHSPIGIHAAFRQLVADRAASVIAAEM